MTSTLDTAIASVDSQRFRAAFRGYAAGVAVITAQADRGPVGFTATSLASVSLAPPLVSFALSSQASSWPTVAVADSIVAHFLAADQHHLAQRFATSGIDRFAAPLSWRRLPTGEPLLNAAAGYIRAVIENRVPAGDHHLIIARVTTAVTRGEYAPLLYHTGGYRTAAAIAREPS